MLQQIKQQIKRLLERSGWQLSIRRVRAIRRRVISLRADGEARGNVLLSLRLQGVLDKGQGMDHTLVWEVHQIAQTWSALGYNVDIIDWKNSSFLPNKDYKFFVDIDTNIKRLAPHLNSDCVKIIHIIFAHFLYHNTATYERHLALQQRRHVTLKPSRVNPDILAIEIADCATYVGNAFTASTFAFAKKPMYRVPLSVQATYPWPEGKDFEVCRNSYLWIGGRGLVHKGLDLVLEAFTDMPEFQLTICGDIHYEKDKDFAKFYHRELYELPNIRTVGWVDVASEAFVDLTRHCVGIVYASCSEGQSGSVLNGVHAGLIPVVTNMSGVDIRDDYGLLIEDLSVRSVQEAARRLSSLPATELERMARTAWEFARANHTREAFARNYREAAEQIIANHATPATTRTNQ